jgi:hypothetical protein
MARVIKDIENPEEEFNKLTDRFRLLQDRFLAVAMDYKYYINSELNDRAVYELRDNVLYRLYSARFHFQLLLEHHARVESRCKELYKKDSASFWRDSFELQHLTRQSEKEIYSLFDSLVYHLCSIYDYLFRLINLCHKNTQVDKPIWNKLFQKKSMEEFKYASKELLPKLQKIDSEFVYPLIGHRSHLIHTQFDTGVFSLVMGITGDSCVATFEATDLFHKNFPGMRGADDTEHFSIKYASTWLIGKTIETVTEILFELRDDMIRNKRIPHGMFVLYDEKNRTMGSPSGPKWGDRNIS